MTSNIDVPKLDRRKVATPLSPVEIQRRYRQRKKLRFLELTESTYARLQAICHDKRWSIEETFIQALTLLEASLQAAAPPAAVVDIRKEPAEDQANYNRTKPEKASVKSRKPKLSPVPEAIDGQGSLL